MNKNLETKNNCSNDVIFIDDVIIMDDMCPVAARKSSNKWTVYSTMLTPDLLSPTLMACF